MICKNRVLISQTVSDSLTLNLRFRPRPWALGTERKAFSSGVYERYLPTAAYTVGQISTPQIERKHLTLRTRMKRLARKTLCFSNSVFMPDTLIGLLVNRYEFGTPI